MRVYRSIAPAWDGQGNPLLDENGIFVNGAMQPRSRTTLPWIPLETGVDYSQTPPVDSNLAGVVPALRPPQIWLYDITEEKWVPSEKAHVGVSALHDNLGFFLHAHPNYLLAGATGKASAASRRRSGIAH